MPDGDDRSPLAGVSVRRFVIPLSRSSSDPLSERTTSGVCDCGGTGVQTCAWDGSPQHAVNCPARFPPVIWPSMPLDKSSRLDGMTDQAIIRIPKYPAAVGEAMIQALGEQARLNSKDPLLAQLEFLRDIERSAAGQLRQTVERLRDLDASWQEIANVLGVTKQAAQQRWGQ